VHSLLFPECINLDVSSAWTGINVRRVNPARRGTPVTPAHHRR
jgi:hypothetical protein